MLRGFDHSHARDVADLEAFTVLHVHHAVDLWRVGPRARHRDVVLHVINDHFDFATDLRPQTRF